MNPASERLRELAQQVAAAAEMRVLLRAALLAGSAGRGDADFFSDLDLLFYVDRVPPDTVLDEIRHAVGGTNPIRRQAPTEQHCGEEFTLDGIRTEISFTTVAHLKYRLDPLLVDLDDVSSPSRRSPPAPFMVRCVRRLGGSHSPPNDWVPYAKIRS